MIAAELHRIPEPRPEEWNIVEPSVLHSSLSRSTSSAIRNHLGWFDLLYKLGVWETGLKSGDPSLENAAIWPVLEFLGQVSAQQLTGRMFTCSQSCERRTPILLGSNPTAFRFHGRDD